MPVPMKGALGRVWIVAALLAGGAAAPAAAQEGGAAATSELGLAELARRPDLWPARVALKRELNFGGGVVLKSGQEVGLRELQGKSAVLDSGEFLFDCPAEETDLLDRARALVASLTPEQLALTVETLRERPELWPLTVALRSTLSFGNGVVLEAGSEVVFRGFEGRSLSAFDRGVQNHFVLEPEECDLLARARARMTRPDEAPFFLRSLEAALLPEPAVATEGEGAAEPSPPEAGAASSAFDGADYVLVYGGRLGCVRCEAFLPELRRFYEQAKPRYGGFEVVFLSYDPTAEAARAYLDKARPPGRWVAFDRRYEAAQLMSVPCNLLPAAFLFDRRGELVARNHPNGGSPAAADVLVDLEARLAARASGGPSGPESDR